MDEFLNRFEQVSDKAPGAGFYKGLMTAMITLGAFVGERIRERNRQLEAKSC